MNNHTFFRKWIFILTTAVLLAACNVIGGTETPVPTVAEVPTEVAPPPTAETEPTAEPTAAPTATDVPLAPTATLAVDPQPTAEEPTPTSEPATAEPTAELTPTDEPITPEDGEIAPGQQVEATLEVGDVHLYTFEGTAFTPVIAFVEGDETLDIALSAYDGAIAPGTDLSTLTAVSNGNFSDADYPEILIISPSKDGPYTIAVQGDEETSGTYTLYLYDGTTATDNNEVVPDTLAAGETKEYTATSNGGRPVMVFVDPTDQSDITLQILYQNGEQIAEANFGGNGSAESVFVLPRTETTYTIRISETNGAASTYNLVIVTLDSLE